MCARHHVPARRQSGEDFERALLHIWLGDRPSDATLKGVMLSALLLIVANLLPVLRGCWLDRHRRAARGLKYPPICPSSAEAACRP